MQLIWTIRTTYVWQWSLSKTLLIAQNLAMTANKEWDISWFKE